MRKFQSNHSVRLTKPLNRRNKQIQGKKMVLRSYLLVAITYAIGFSSTNPLSQRDELNDKIVGGFVTTIEKNPWQVAMLSSGYQSCGGSIIGEKWVLSAAHCSGYEKLC